MSEQTTLTRAWTVDGFRAFWTNPDPAIVPRIRDVCTPDIVGHWPQPIGLVRGAVPYVEVIAAIFAVCPDFRLTVPEDAGSGSLHFIRWEAAGTGPNGERFAFDGIDRVRTNADGLVAENYVVSDGPLFPWVAEYLRRQAS